MEKFNKQSKFNERIYELLEDSFQNETQECIVDEIIRNANFSDIEKVLEILVSQKIYDEKRIKKLKHDKDTTVGLYAFDKELDSIFENIPNKKDCKTAVEAYLAQQIEYLKSIVFRIY